MKSLYVEIEENLIEMTQNVNIFSYVTMERAVQAAVVFHTFMANRHAAGEAIAAVLGVAAWHAAQ